MNGEGTVRTSGGAERKRRSEPDAPADPGRADPGWPEISGAPVQTATPVLEEQFQLLSHDVRNHVIAVNRNLELLQAGGAGPINESQAKILGATRDCAELLLGLTSDILDLSSYEKGRLRLALTPFNLIDVITTSVRLCRGAGVDRDVRLRFDPERAGAQVRADRFRILRVLVNLLMNAIEFSPPCGTVRVACGEGERRFVVSVTDEGPGIGRKHQRRVFQKHYRVPGNGVPSRAGLGLGLYFCRRTILAHAGRIWIESPLADQRHGTRVLFTLPSTEPEAGA